MDDNQVSRMALWAAYARAYHAAHDTPKIFDDTLACHLITEEKRAYFEKMVEKTMTILKYVSSGGLKSFFIKLFFPKHLRDAIQSIAPKSTATFSDQSAAKAWVMQFWVGTSLILSRARYTEDSLEEAVRQGVKQYVILGAGMDTFAFRRKELLAQLQVFEIDHPATQAFKISRLAELGWEPPAQLHFISTDFTQESLSEVLKRSSYDPQVPTFFNWLGVTYYLPRDVVFATFRTIADIAGKGSKVICIYTR